MTTGEHDIPPFDRMRDHWWWRPGFRIGRTFYAWHLTFDDAPDLHRLAREYAPALDIPGLDAIPVQWLHLTMQGVGFTDEVPSAEIDAIAEAARRRLADLAPFDVTIGPTVTEPEVVRLQVAPAEPVAQVRLAIRAGIADVWGADRVPEEESDFIPHVSLAYSSSDGPAEPILRAAESVDVTPAKATISAAQLIVLNRDNRQYQWTTYSSVPFTRKARDEVRQRDRSRVGSGPASAAAIVLAAVGPASRARPKAYGRPSGPVMSWAARSDQAAGRAQVDQLTARAIAALTALAAETRGGVIAVGRPRRRCCPHRGGAPPRGMLSGWIGRWWR